MEENKITEFNDSHVGKYITCYINGICITDAKVQKQGNSYYICQNSEDGDGCNDKLGYKYSWSVYDGTPHMISDNSVTKIFLKESVKQKLKPGDYVDFINPTEPGAYNFNGNLTNLEVRKEADSGGMIAIWTKDKSTYHFTYEKCLKLSTITNKEPIFKPGDIVRFKSSSSYNAKYFKKGHFGLEIHSIDSEHTCSLYERDKSNRWNVGFNELELDTSNYRTKPDELEHYSESGFFEKMKDLGKQDVEEIKVEHKKKPKRYVQIENMDNIN